jgi:hypothetical protein
MSHTCAHVTPASAPSDRSASHPEHCSGGSTCSVRSGRASGTSPDPAARRASDLSSGPAATPPASPSPGLGLNRLFRPRHRGIPAVPAQLPFQLGDPQLQRGYPLFLRHPGVPLRGQPCLGQPKQLLLRVHDPPQPGVGSPQRLHLRRRRRHGRIGHKPRSSPLQTRDQAPRPVCHPNTSTQVSGTPEWTPAGHRSRHPSLLSGGTHRIRPRPAGDDLAQSRPPGGDSDRCWTPDSRILGHELARRRHPADRQQGGPASVTRRPPGPAGHHHQPPPRLSVETRPYGWMDR